MVPGFGGHAIRQSARTRLAMIEGISFWNSLRNDFFSLSDYVGAVGLQLRRLGAESDQVNLVGAPSSWPKRPPYSGPWPAFRQ